MVVIQAFGKEGALVILDAVPATTRAYSGGRGAWRAARTAHGARPRLLIVLDHFPDAIRANLILASAAGRAAVRRGVTGDWIPPELRDVFVRSELGQHVDFRDLVVGGASGVCARTALPGRRDDVDQTLVVRHERPDFHGHIPAALGFVEVARERVVRVRINDDLVLVAPRVRVELVEDEVPRAVARGLTHLEPLVEQRDARILHGLLEERIFKQALHLPLSRLGAAVRASAVRARGTARDDFIREGQLGAVTIFVRHERGFNEPLLGTLGDDALK